MGLDSRDKKTVIIAHRTTTVAAKSKFLAPRRSVPAGVIPDISDVYTRKVQEWFIELLGSQQPEGFFKGRIILVQKLGLSRQQFRRRVQRLCKEWGVSQQVETHIRQRLVITWLSIGPGISDRLHGYAKQRAKPP